MPLEGPLGLLRKGGPLAGGKQRPGMAEVVAAASLAPLPAQMQTQHSNIPFKSLRIINVVLHTHKSSQHSNQDFVVQNHAHSAFCNDILLLLF